MENHKVSQLHVLNFFFFTSVRVSPLLDLLVTISSHQQSIHTIFPDKDEMSNFLLKLRASISSAAGTAIPNVMTDSYIRLMNNLFYFYFIRFLW